MKNEPAFPCEWAKVHHTPGMTLRDYFAAKAMQGLLSTEYFRGMPYKLVAEDAYRAADAMMEARDAA